MKKAPLEASVAGGSHLPADDGNRSKMLGKISLAGVMLLIFISGWIMGSSKIPPNPNDPKYETAVGRDADGNSVIAVREYRDTNSPWIPVYRIPGR